MRTTVILHPDGLPNAISLYNGMVEILYEDDYLIAVNKPAGLASVPAPKIPEKNTLMGKVQALYREKGFKPYILHRLDRETSGVVLFGKYPRNREKLEGIFQNGTTEKTYLALVKGVPKKKGMITFPLEARNSTEKIPAKTHYAMLKIFDDYSLVEVQIETGRHHQIRKHFAQISHPLINDFDYGDKKFNRRFQLKYGTHFMFLHAKMINFEHPFLQKNLAIVAATPKNFQKFSKP